MTASSPIRIAALPGRRTRGVLLLGGQAVPVALGRGGIRADKREGDGGTPRGLFKPLRVWWRADRGPRPRTALPVRRIDLLVAWCEDPRDRRYNRPFRRTRSDEGDRLWRDDRLYDLIVEIDHNSRPRVAHRGSAVFVHVARAGFAPTAGCVALTEPALRRLLSRLSPQSRLLIR